MRSEIKHVDDDIAILRLRGKITIAVGDIVLREDVHRLLSQGKKGIIVDLREVTALDSSGNGELTSAYTTAANSGAKLGLIVKPGGKIWDILEITQVKDFHRIFSSEEEAIKGIKSEGFSEFYGLNVDQK
ncbi:MAG TPA: STAS domain-containing protein [Thermoanaerobaculia bacterium]|nr:STAS domain-containing protein [Thermoanaerobaculia bacterium]